MNRPPNIKQLDFPPTKKNRTANAAPEFHIAVNLAPTPGAEAPALQGTCVVSNSQNPQPRSVATPGPSRLENVDDIDDTSSAPDARPLGRRVYISEARKKVLQLLLDCAMTDRVPSTWDVLTWMDIECPEVDGFYRDSYGELAAFEVDDALNIIANEVCHLGTFGHLDTVGAQKVRQYTQDKVLIPLNLWETDLESFDSGDHAVDLTRVFNWHRGVTPGYVEDGMEDDDNSKKVKVEEVDDVEEVQVVGGDGEYSDIEEIEDWRAPSEEI